jgi:hypothetical protein
MSNNKRKMYKKTIPGMGGRGKGEWWRGKFNYDIFDILQELL